MKRLLTILLLLLCAGAAYGQQDYSRGFEKDSLKAREVQFTQMTLNITVTYGQGDTLYTNPTYVATGTFITLDQQGRIFRHKTNIDLLRPGVLTTALRNQGRAWVDAVFLHARTRRFAP